MTADYRDISTVPRDGTTVDLIADGDGPWRMRWNARGSNPIASTGVGIWETPCGSVTWCEDRGGGPTHWRKVA